MNKNFIKFWITQSLSLLGSAMTSYALVIWVYDSTNSALSVSIIALSRFIPYILASIISGPIIDRNYKKKILVISDSIAAVSTIVLLLFYREGFLSPNLIYICNFINGLSQAFQSPAESSTLGLLVEEKDYARASGMDTFSGNITEIIAPFLAVYLATKFSIISVFAFDLISFLIAVVSLMCFIDIDEKKPRQSTSSRTKISDYAEGYIFLNKNSGIMSIIIFMLFINLFSRLTYENILSPMILARTSGNKRILSLVSGSMGLGGLIGSIILSLGLFDISPRKMIFISTAISFCLGDLILAISNSYYMWMFAGVMSSFPIPFIFAGQRILIYKNVPEDLRGRVFAWRNAVQMSSIPIAIFLGGYLSDYIFEPFMEGTSALARILGILLSNSPGSGMRLMFLITGISGIITSIKGYRNKNIIKLENSEKHI